MSRELSHDPVRFTPTTIGETERGRTLVDMGSLLPAASALGLGMLAGVRLYATVFVVGLLLRFHWIALPSDWRTVSALADTRVLILAGIACVIEFIADKIPWLDSAWDGLHTFIRPIGAALLASSLLAHVDPVYQVLLFLLAGGVALTQHSAKAAVRLAVNHSPEPISNVTISLIEDAAFAGGMYLLVKHPWVMAGISLALLLSFALLARPIYRAVRADWKALGARLRSWMGESGLPKLDSAQQAWLVEHGAGQTPSRCFAVVATAEMKGFRNAVGTLCLAGNEAVFFTRRWGRLLARELGPVLAIEARMGFLVDELVVVGAGGVRQRFDLLGGQLKAAREEAQRRAALPALPHR
ncbi:MAG TPA: DUF4126 domain-containing protein [Bryobacteraceae bacterium]|nr:DUF4126 domain-containing protein [Bryobacteraceae bacterium]